MTARIGLVILAWALCCGARPAGTRFAEGLVALVRADAIADVRAISARLGVTLRNPQKWTHQPEGGRDAGWASPPGRSGISSLRLGELIVSGYPDIHATLEIELTGRPCISLAAIERAAGTRASFGGIVSMMVMDGPPMPPRQLGNENATIEVRNRRGEAVGISTVSSRPYRAGCIRSLIIESTRPPAPHLAPH